MSQQSWTKIQGQNVTDFGINYYESVCHTVTNFTNFLGWGMSQFGVDRQSFHFETECHSSKLSQQMVCWVDALFGPICHVVGSWMDGSSKHHFHKVATYCWRLLLRPLNCFRCDQGQ
jgi:hypothetical protein